MVRWYAATDGTLAEVCGVDGWVELEGGVKEPPVVATFAFDEDAEASKRSRADVSFARDAWQDPCFAERIAAAVCHVLADKIRIREA